VDENGLVTAKKGGQATITVTTHNGLTASCNVNVYVQPKKVSLNAKKLKLNANDGFQLVAKLTKNSISQITWSSDNPGVASVDENGLVAAMGPGKATIYATTTNGKTAKCKVTVSANPSQVPGMEGLRGNLVYYEETETLRVTITNDNGLYLTYIWAANPVQQLLKHYGHDTTDKILQDAIGVNGLQGRLVIGFNASPPVNEVYRTAWNSSPDFHNREPSPLMITNGAVLVNNPYITIDGKNLYWIDANNQLRFSPKQIEEMTVEERAALYQEIINSGARNTMLWQPVLISDYQPVPLSATVLKKFDGSLKKQALCQVDSNNFILVSSSESGKMSFPDFQQYLLNLGVKTAVTLDGGGSVSLLLKSRNSTEVKRITGGGRSLTSVMYFTELG